jgi:hypothetical protein
VTGPLLASGREADVYALDDHRALRRYRREADVTGEVTAMRYLAGLGHPTRLPDEVVRSRDRQLSGTEPLDRAAERVLACAR